ncbi:MAG TPA: hypothetical protein VGI85_04150 [Chthoniobacterales bacterium]|jgi:hypothetical protein
MIFRLGRAATILALCLSLGFHWLALQSVAWTAMLVTNAQHLSLSEAVAKTFDGAHPCNLCHAVAKGRKSEKKSEAVPTIAKMDLICPPRLRIWQPPVAPYGYAVVRFEVVERTHAPPAPPPRFFVA